MAEDKIVKASCLCGGAAHEIRLSSADLPLKVFICHCDSCRHSTGTLCFTVAAGPAHYKPDLGLLSLLQPFEISKKIIYYHCPRCGSQMLATMMVGEIKCWGFASGTLEQVDGVIQVMAHEHIADTLDGGFSDFLQSIDGSRIPRKLHGLGGEADVDAQLWWKSSNAASPSASSQRLRCYCKCGGVNFWIAKPSERSVKLQRPPKDQPWWLRHDGTRFLGGICACDSCRLGSGMEWQEWAFVPIVDISLDAEGKVPFSRSFGTLKQYRSTTKPCMRYFCEICGATVFWDGDDRPELIDVAVGLLDAKAGARAEAWLHWWTNRLSYQEDAMSRAASLTLAVEAGLKEYGERRYKYRK
ncbi:hypothetical protein EJ03DRAFT_265975 [Teratosphaeria nubilosa]|uniref:CENP-V/GFA domain-containing protein n=1 Tax=Teratosphaeria nubilosa TaxID=161662 RepID=A0A6G1LJP8_9PEZI|nr:hypothetical protein EJ03DRAFT_265975 [Teratosphaeria nubilosa]